MKNIIFLVPVKSVLGSSILHYSQRITDIGITIQVSITWRMFSICPDFIKQTYFPTFLWRWDETEWLTWNELFLFLSMNQNKTTKASKYDRLSTLHFVFSVNEDCFICWKWCHLENQSFQGKLCLVKMEFHYLSTRLKNLPFSKPFHLQI